METKVTVSYLHHSGFTIAFDKTLLVFDYWEGEKGELPPEWRLNDAKLNAYDRVYVFISHNHPDHLDPVVYTWKPDAAITYIVSHETPIGTRGRRMAPGDVLALDTDLIVKAFDSTDLGVSYLVDVNGVRIFHAGDLNLWHWRQESTLKQIEAAEQAFESAMAPIVKEKIDIAMFPVDPRQGPMFDSGANHFILAVKPRLFLPMHFQGRGEVAVDFARRARTKHTEVLALTQPGDRVEALITEEESQFTLIAAKKLLPVKEAEKNRETDLKSHDDSDPFADTDLPVDL